MPSYHINIHIKQYVVIGQTWDLNTNPGEITFPMSQAHLPVALVQSLSADHTFRRAKLTNRFHAVNQRGMGKWLNKRNEKQSHFHNLCKYSEENSWLHSGFCSSPTPRWWKFPTRNLSFGNYIPYYRSDVRNAQHYWTEIKPKVVLLF